MHLDLAACATALSIGHDECMAKTALTTLIVAYDDVDIALSDHADLVREAKRRHREHAYQAAVIHQTDAGLEVVATTVREHDRATLLGAGLGFVAGALVSPILPVAIVGTGIGVAVGHVLDQVDAFKHAHHKEVRQLVDGSSATMIVISDPASINELRATALARQRRVVVLLEAPDVDLLERELQQAGQRFRLPGESLR
jgi:hypothetical protein